MEAIPPTPLRRGKSLSVPRSISGFGEMWRFRKLPKNASNMKNKLSLKQENDMMRISSGTWKHFVLLCTQEGEEEVRGPQRQMSLPPSLLPSHLNRHRAMISSPIPAHHNPNRMRVPRRARLSLASSHQNVATDTQVLQYIFRPLYIKQVTLYYCVWCL